MRIIWAEKDKVGLSSQTETGVCPSGQGTCPVGLQDTSAEPDSE